MKNDIFVEIAYQKVNFHGDRICGDSFIQRYIPSQERTVAILSDGMGHGIKANILSSLTSSILVNMVETNEDLRTIAHTILKTLPVCSVRGISYSTFSIFDFHHKDNRVDIVEYDNPQSVIIRHGELFMPQWECFEIAEEQTQTTRRTILTTSFEAKPEDVIIICSDGVTQSGLGSDKMPFGWGEKRLREFVLNNLTNHPDVSCKCLSLNVLLRAIAHDADCPKDDISCVAIHLRKPQKLLFCSCPPTIEVKSREISEHIASFDGKTAISGYQLAELVGRELGVPIDKNLTSTDPDVPPVWKIRGVDLVTEGLITLGKVLDILEKHQENVRGRGAAYRLCEMLFEADVIEMIIGLRERVDTPTVWTDDYVLRRKVLKAIAEIMESKFNKQVTINYL